MGESGDIISMVAVAAVAMMIYKRGSEIFESVTEPGAVSNTVSEVYKETKETLIKETKSDVQNIKESVKDTALDVLKNSSPAYMIYQEYGQKNDEKILQYLKDLKDSLSPGKEKTSSPGISKTYHTGDTAYDKYVDDLTNTWTSNLEANKKKNLAAKAKTQNSTAGSKTSSTKTSGTDVHGRSPANDRYKKK